MQGRATPQQSTLAQPYNHKRVQLGKAEKAKYACSQEDEGRGGE